MEFGIVKKKEVWALLPSAHYQFETIHPFLDGNGQVGRVLITFQLCCQGVLKQPLLCLSDYFKRHRDEYYSFLQKARDSGEIERWLEFGSFSWYRALRDRGFRDRLTGKFFDG